MSCMKCGRDVEEGQVFCNTCLADMANYPVKPNTAIQLPHRKDGPGPKKAHPKRRQAPRPEEKVLAMKKWLRFMLAMWLITLLLLIASLYPTVEYFMGNSFRHTGQNYNTMTGLETTQP